MTNLTIKIAAACGFALAFSPLAAQAGKGGSAQLIQQAVQSHSQDAIIAELEHTESLICDECVSIVTPLTEDSRFEVRQAAAWWFARRPALAGALADGFRADLTGGTATAVRNAADFFGGMRDFKALPQLRIAITRASSSDAKLAIVRAVGFMAHTDGNGILVTAMGDQDPAVRAAAVTAWRDMLGQANAQPVIALLGDGAAQVRAQAATVIGGLRDQAGRAQLEALVVSDADAKVRRNAAWALGQLGNASSRVALTKASTDASPLVGSTARASLTYLH
ncbi:MAG TPA: HEAT repeat domain-containing protein [Kofleriaceae bacterium]|jgi:hypothetical protein